MGGRGTGQCNGEKGDEEERKGRGACLKKQRGVEGTERQGCRTVSAYVREDSSNRP